MRMEVSNACDERMSDERMSGERMSDERCVMRETRDANGNE
jgi:hypothetical protein